MSGAETGVIMGERAIMGVGDELPVLDLDRRRAPERNALRLYGGATSDILTRRRASDGPRMIVTPNLDHWRLLDRSRAFRAAYSAATIVVNDSRFLMKTVFGRAATTLPGSELVLMMLDAAPTATCVLVIGCPRPVREFLSRRRSDLVFDHLEPSFGFVFRRAERRAIVEHAQATAPDRIFVCVGAPQSEVLAHQLQRRLTHGCDILCCGAGLQFAAGLKSRAPGWMQRSGLEWAWRAGREPHTRLRYLLDALFLAAKAPALARLRGEGRASLARYSVTSPPRS